MSDLPLYLQILLVILPGFLAGIGGWIWGRYNRRWLGISLGVIAMGLWLIFGWLLLSSVQ